MYPCHPSDPRLTMTAFAGGMGSNFTSNRFLLSQFPAFPIFQFSAVPVSSFFFPLFLLFGLPVSQFSAVPSYFNSSMNVRRSAMSCTLIPASSPSGIRLFPEELLPLMFVRGNVTSAPPMILNVRLVASSRAIMPV